MGGRNYTDRLSMDEQREYGRKAREADDKFRELMRRAGYREHVQTRAGTDHPRFTPHRALPPRTGSPASECADANGDSNTTEYR